MTPNNDTPLEQLPLAPTPEPHAAAPDSAAPTATPEPSTAVVVAAATPTPLSAPIEDVGDGSIAAFASLANFRAAQRMAEALSKSDMVPTQYRGSIPNCLIAMDISSRTGASVLMVMQNLYVIQGRPSWGSPFLIGSVNSSGRFTRMKFEVEGDVCKPGWKGRAYAKELLTGDVLYGAWITWEMIKAEGWYDKAGSKWKTMGEQMMMYRSAAFWTRIYAPEISLGMHTTDEVGDMNLPTQTLPSTGALNDLLDQPRAS